MLLNYQIRKATFKEAPLIAKVRLQCWRESYHDLLDSYSLKKKNYSYYLKKHTERLKNQQDLCVIRNNCKQEKIIGLCTAIIFKLHNNQHLSSQDLKK